MDARDPRRIAHERKRWLRPDWRRFMPPGFEWPDVREAEEAAWIKTREAEAEALAHLRWMLKDLKVELMLARLRRKYSPDQPRVPAGNRDGGQWTSGGGTGRNDPRVLSDATPGPVRPGARYAQATSRRYSVNLTEEEAPRGIGHTIRDHVGKTDEELLEVLRPRRFDFPFASFVGKRDGSFSSLESANDFVNRTLEQNKDAVDLVASGKVDRDFVTSRFGYVTGREAFRPDPDADPYARNTLASKSGMIRARRMAIGFLRPIQETIKIATWTRIP